MKMIRDFKCAILITELYQLSPRPVSSFGFSDGMLTCLHISSPGYHPPGSV